MSRKRALITSIGVVAVVTFAAVAFGLGMFSQNSSAEAQSIDGNNNRGGRGLPDDNGGDGGNGQEELISTAINVLGRDPSPEAAEEAISHGMEHIIGNFRPLPTKGEAFEQTMAAHESFSAMEKEFGTALTEFIRRGRSAEEKGYALNAQQILVEMGQMADNLAQITSQCGVGDFVLMLEGDNFDNPCSQLQPLMNHSTGLEDEPVFSEDDTVFGEIDSTFKPIDPLTRSYSVNLRADLIPPRWSRDIPEHVEITEPLAPGECSVVFKEFRGLLLQLHIEGITTVKDPGNKSGVSGTTREPIWVLRWMPAQYGKQWSMCNTGSSDAPEVTTNVTRQIVEDEGLVYFWRFYD